MFMDIEKLLALFPQANLGEKQAGAISFRQGDAFLNIPVAELSEKERKILEIFLGKTADFEVECGVWQDYLTKKSNVKPIKRGKIRFIQYEIRSLNQAEFDMEMFKKAFSALFPKEPEAVFFLSKNSGVAIEKINAASFDKEEFKGIIQALDAEAVTARVSSGSGNIRITLKDMQDRDYTQMEVAEKLSKAVQKKTMARSFVQQSSSFGGRRGGMPVQYVLQATNIEKLQEILPKFMAKVYENPVFQMADVDLKFSKPEARININRDKASIMGVSTRNIAQTLQYGLSGQRMGYFYMNGKQYEILGEINRQQRNKPADLKGIYIRSSQGDMVQLDNLIELTNGIAPPKLYRYNRFVSATISAGLADGKTIGQGLDEMDKIAKETLDDTFRTALTGDSKEYRESSSSLMFAFILAILLIYLILAAQFESFKDPLIIMLTVPLAIAGALVFMYFGDITMNIFSQIGIIMLIGLVAKNGILIVEFANQKQEAGEDKMQAIKDAALQRLRPILMTSASTVLGLIPLAFATGEGCNQRIAMGTAVVGGMLVSTLLTMYIVPAIYSYVSTNRSKLKNE